MEGPNSNDRTDTLVLYVVIPLRGEPLSLSELTGGGGKDPSEWPVKTPGLFLYSIFPLRFLSLQVLLFSHFTFLVNNLLCHVCRNNYVPLCQKRLGNLSYNKQC
jgi:hypothetical protein